MKRFTVKIIVSGTLIILSSTFVLYAYSTGITGATKKNGSGCTCHNPTESSSVNASINGPDAMKPGETANFTVTVSGGPLVSAGTNIASSAGTLIPKSGLQLISGELTHITPKAPAGGIVTFDFSYTAPSTIGNVTLFANGNSVNLNGNNSGDQWNFAANKTINVTNATEVEKNEFAYNFKLEQNFPNPFNPSTIISYTIPQNAFVSINIYDINGKIVRSFINSEQTAGSHSFIFSSDNLASGVYTYTLNAGNHFETKKMLLTK